MVVSSVFIAPLPAAIEHGGSVTLVTYAGRQHQEPCSIQIPVAPAGQQNGILHVDVAGHHGRSLHLYDEVYGETAPAPSMWRVATVGLYTEPTCGSLPHGLPDVNGR